MSRLQREYVWYHYFALSPRAHCMCCKLEVLDIADGPDVWVMGHVIHAGKNKGLGSDIYENIRPICIACNHDDVNFKTSYHYMVSIGTMKEEELEPALEKIRAAVSDRQRHPEKYTCTAKTKGGTSSCNKPKLPHMKVCMLHCHIESLIPNETEKHLASLMRSTASLLKANLFSEKEKSIFEDSLSILREKRYIVATERSRPKVKKERAAKIWERKGKRLESKAVSESESDEDISYSAETDSDDELPSKATQPESIENSNNEPVPPRRSSRLAEKEAKKKTAAKK